MTPTTREIAKTSGLPRHDDSPIWADHQVASEAAAKEFSGWMDSQLDELEARFSRYQTRRSVKTSLSR